MVAGVRPTATDPTTTAAPYPAGRTSSGGHQAPATNPTATTTVVVGATRWRHRIERGCMPSTIRFHRPYCPNCRAKARTEPRGR